MEVYCMRIGLVLAGGGAKGAYEIGVWKALEEIGISKYIKVVSGSSIGAINGLLFLENNLEKSMNIWEKLNNEDILPITNLELLIKKFFLNIGLKNIWFIKKYTPQIIFGGNISRRWMEELFDSIDLLKVKQSNKKLYVACTEIPEMKIEYFDLVKHEDSIIKKILMASSAIPMIFKEEMINSRNYLDGGLVDNLPITPVYKEKCDFVIVVNITRNSYIDREEFKGMKFIEIKPTRLDENNEIDEVLEFESLYIQKRIQLGYLDTISTLKFPVELINRIAEEEKEEKRMINKLRRFINLNNYK